MFKLNWRIYGGYNIHVSEGTMNKRKDPSRLQDMVYRKVGEMVRKVGLNWTRRLYAAAVSARSTWLQEIQFVEAECVLLRQKISSLPLPINSELINRYIILNFTQIVASHHNNSGLPLSSIIMDREIHQKVCENILKSVLLPCVSTCNLSIVKSEFVEELLLKLIYLTPNTEVLIVLEVQSLDYMNLLVQNIQILNHLQEFKYRIGCTTEIIVELSKYCPHLKNINIECSILVNNNCVEYLLKLRHLQNLNVAGTSILSNGYRALLSGLPVIQDIIWFNTIDPVLMNLMGRLDSVTRFAANIISAELVAQKCPNITELILLHTTNDMSGLGELRHVSKFRMVGGICFYIQFSLVIGSLGANLTALEMNHVRDIYIDDIFNFCSVLSSIDFKNCYIEQREIPDRNLPHFQNLKKLKLKSNIQNFELSSLLPTYVNLNEFHVADMSVINETRIRRIVFAGGFKHLTTFVVDGCGDMSIDIARLLIHNCPNLTELGNIYTWPRVRIDEIETFSNFVRDNNLSLTFLR
jgi:hypothetical protein